MGALLVLVAFVPGAFAAPAAAPASSGTPTPASAAALSVDGQPAPPFDRDDAARAPVRAGSVGAHGNHLAADPQISGDGTVVIETLFTLRPGFAVLWTTDDGGGRGEPVGHTYLPGGQFRTDVSVSVRASVWNGWSGNRTLRAVLHRDDGDGEFDPETDPPLTARNPTASVEIPVGVGEGSEGRDTGGSDDGDGGGEGGGADRVLADHVDPIPVSGGAVTVRRVDLSASGFVAIASRDGDAVVGATRLPAGSHRNVSVDLNESFLADRNERFLVRAVAYRDDGDGVFDAADRRVTVGDDSVATAFTVRKGDADEGSLVNTPRGTPIPSATPPPATAGPGTGGTPTPSSTPIVETPLTATAESGGLGPGSGVGGVLVALVVALVVAAFVGIRRR